MKGFAVMIRGYPPKVQDPESGKMSRTEFATLWNIAIAVCKFRGSSSSGRQAVFQQDENDGGKEEITSIFCVAFQLYETPVGQEPLTINDLFLAVMYCNTPLKLLLIRHVYGYYLFTCPVEVDGTATQPWKRCASAV